MSEVKPINLSQKRREEMLGFLEKLKKDTENSENYNSILREINQIESFINEKKYGLVWEQHEEAVDAKMKTHIPVFKEVKEREILHDKDLPFNFLLEGDNLHSLKLLEKTHRGKIDVIYIDPPYNTGNKDFIYNDKYVDKNDGYSHSKWLSFMSERLKIAKNLLSDEGVIFISIDENEFAQLKLLCYEVFGETNVDDIVWQKMDSRVDRNTNAKSIRRYKSIHENIVICYKDKQSKLFSKVMRKPDWKNVQKNQDRDPRGPWQSGIMSYEEGHKNEDVNSIYYYEVTTPTGIIYKRHWHVTQEEFKKLEQDNRIYYSKNGDGVPRKKIFENEEAEYYMDSILRGFGTSSTAKDEILLLFNDRDKFNTPKPIKMIKELIRVASIPNSTVLDFFAGSGTTGHAVMQLNKEDGGNRKYILCTNNENNICEEVTYQRLKNIQSDLPHNLKYYKTDFIEKFSSDEVMVLDKMMSYIKELIELEYHINLDDKRCIIVDNENIIDEAINTIDNGGKLFIKSGILLTTEHYQLLLEKEITIVDIPEYYFKSELKEVGEL